METIQLGDAFAPVISWLAAFLFAVFAGGSLLILLKLVLPWVRDAMRGRANEPGGFVFKMFAGFALVAGLLAWVCFGVIGQDPHTLELTEQGDWVLRNPFGGTISRIPGDQLRTVELGSERRQFWSSTGAPPRTFDFLIMQVASEGGQKIDISTNDGQNVLLRLGYGDLRQYPFPPHRYRSGGPVWELPFEPGAAVMANWAKDPWYYYARIRKGGPRLAEVRYDDGSLEWLPWSALRGIQIPATAIVNADYQGKGSYWACKLAAQKGERVTVIYEDRSREQTTVKRLRIQLPPKGK